jgi:hypothetical protein
MLETQSIKEHANKEIKRIAKNLNKFILRYKGNERMIRIDAIFAMELEDFEDKQMAKTLVYNALSQEAREKVFTPVGMDAKGNYTEDQTKWA